MQKAERKIFASVLQHEDQRLEVFWIARQCVGEDQGVVEEKCVWMDNGLSAFSDSDKKEAWS